MLNNVDLDNDQLMQEINRRFRTKETLYTYLVGRSVSIPSPHPNCSVAHLPATKGLLHPGLHAATAHGGEDLIEPG